MDSKLPVGGQDAVDAAPSYSNGFRERLIDRIPTRSQEASEFMTRVPSFLTRWGATMALMVLICTVVVLSLIKYPDTAAGSAVITTSPLPLRPKCNVQGRIARLFAHNGDSVTFGAPICEIENDAGYEAVSDLHAIIDSVSKMILTGDAKALSQLQIHKMPPLGEAQQFYNSLESHIAEWLLIHEKNIHASRLSNVRRKIDKYGEIDRLTTEESMLSKDELADFEERIAANEKLFKNKYISRVEYLDELSKLRNKQLALKQQKRAVLMSGINDAVSRQEQVELEWSYSEKAQSLQRAIFQDLKEIANFIGSWKKKFLILAPFDGVVYFLRPLQLYQATDAGQELFAVVPTTYKYTAIATFSANGLGRIRPGQSAQLSLLQYPDNEFGYITSNVVSVSPLALPGDNSGNAYEADKARGPQYQIELHLDNGLMTTYHRDIKFNPEMYADVRIFTDDKSMLDRFIRSVTGRE